MLPHGGRLPELSQEELTESMAREFHTSRKQHQSMLQVGRHAAHALLLCVLTTACLLAIFHRPRTYPSVSLRDGDGEVLARLLRHPGVADRDWRYIVVHHSATKGGSAAAFERYHIHVRKWTSLGYHFVIGNGTQTDDGEIEVGGRWHRQEIGSHAVGYNVHGIGICLVGNFDQQRPTQPQLQALRALVLLLSRRHNIPPAHVIGHRECEGAQTACPGRNLNTRALRDWLSLRLRRPSHAATE